MDTSKNTLAIRLSKDIAGVFIFEDSNIKILWQPTLQEFVFILTNKTNVTMVEREGRNERIKD